MTTEQTTTTPIDRDVILDALAKHINQRTGMDWRNYYSDWRDTEGRKAFASEYREVLRDGRDARALLSYVRRSFTITGEEVLAACKRTFSGRLSFDVSTQEFNYCTGQYWPTEYRAAACAVLVAVLWERAVASGDRRKWARNEFGRGIAARWFN